MKKLISFIVLIALSLSLFGCAKAPELDSATPDALTEDKAQDAEVVNPEQPENQPVQTPEQPEHPENQPQQTQDEQQEPLDKAPPCDVTIDEPFSDFEVVVSFTLEESAKDKEYTPLDFAAVDCFNVFPFDYYPEDIHPEYKDRKTVILMLSEQSKQGVLDAVAVLQKDDRIYSAEPSFIINYDPELIDTVFCNAYLTEEELNKIKDQYATGDFFYTPEDFPEIQIVPINKKTFVSPIEADKHKLLGVRLHIKSNDFEAYKKIVSDERVKYIKATLWELRGEEPDMIRVLMKENAVFKKSDYPEIDIARIVTSDEDSVVIELAKGGYKEMGKALYIFNNHPKTVKVYQEYVGDYVVF